jgi:signal transduction histidine kinase/ActR/RegA family two-component response regulator
MEYLSEGCLHLTGYEPTFLLDPKEKEFSDLIHVQDRKQVWDKVQAALASKMVFELTYRIIDSSNQEKWVWERGRGIFSDDGTLLALEGFVTDFTSIKTEHQNSLNMERKFQETQKLESLGLMAGSVAHDFNNLLTIIQGYSDLAKQDLPKESSVQNYLSSIEKASHQAADLALQMLAYSGRGQFVVGAINLNELIVKNSQMMKVSISKNAILHHVLAEDLPLFQGDPTQITQVIMNLVTNASEAAEDQNLTINLESGVMDCGRDFLDDSCNNRYMICDEPLPVGQYVFIEVSDTGCGMDQKVVDKVFEPFFTTKFTGRGLGLAATLGIIRGHKGLIQVASMPGEGTRIKVLFPVSSTVSKSENTPQIANSQQHWRGHGTILLADDEELLRELGQTMLAKLGFNVLVTSDGQEALDKFKENAHDIVAVLLDLTMPRMNGLKAMQEIWDHKPGTKIILCSGYAETDVLKDFQETNHAGFLHKPYNLKQMTEQLENVLEQPN